MTENTHSLDQVKNNFTFRLGTTSYIIPDDILPNIKFLADKVDDVELVLFESDELSNIPSPSLVKELREVARHNDLTFTVHLPLDTWTGNKDEAIRKASVEKHKRIIDRMAPLEPFAYICHLHGDQRGKEPAFDPENWFSQHTKSMEELITVADPKDLCIETLDYPFSMVKGIVEEFNLAVCLDVGHLIVNGYPVEEHLDKYFDKARVFHLHGVKHPDKDHRDISHLSHELLDMVISRLDKATDKERVCTLEIFTQRHFETSLEVLDHYAGNR